MKLVKKIAVVAGVAAIALTSVAVFAKGYFILNQDGSTYTTQNPASCPGVTFPASVKYDETIPSNNNQITINPAVAGTQHCVKTYDNGSQQGGPADASCVITLKVKHGKVVKLSAHGYNTLPSGKSCQVDNSNHKHAHNVELLYSGS